MITPSENRSRSLAPSPTTSIWEGSVRQRPFDRWPGSADGVRPVRQVPPRCAGSLTTGRRASRSRDGRCRPAGRRFASRARPGSTPVRPGVLGSSPRDVPVQREQSTTSRPEGYVYWHISVNVGTAESRLALQNEATQFELTFVAPSAAGDKVGADADAQPQLPKRRHPRRRFDGPLMGLMGRRNAGQPRPKSGLTWTCCGADDRTRTGDPHLGKKRGARNTAPRRPAGVSLHTRARVRRLRSPAAEVVLARCWQRPV